MTYDVFIKPKKKQLSTFLSAAAAKCEIFFFFTRITVSLGYISTGITSGRSHNLQLSISRVQFCSSSGYLLRSIMQAAVVVILGAQKEADGALGKKTKKL